DAGRYATESRLPGCPILVAKSDLQFRRLGNHRSREDFLTPVDTHHRLFAGFRIGEGAQSHFNVSQQLVHFRTGTDDAVSLASFEIHIDLSQTKRIRLAARPIHVGEKAAMTEKIF